MCFLVPALYSTVVHFTAAQWMYDGCWLSPTPVHLVKNVRGLNSSYPTLWRLRSVARFWSSLRPVRPNTLKPIRLARLAKRTMPGVAGKRWSWTHSSWRATSKLKCIAASSMS